MLKELTIENIAVIEKANIEFNMGFTCITGETGAGKSIIIDAINAIMGERVSKDAIRHGANKAYIVAVFDDIDKEIVKRAYEYGIDIEQECIVSRVISNDSKSSARINGVPVPVSVIKYLFSDAINIHGQHDNQSLLDSSRHLTILDSFSNDNKLLQTYYNTYEKYAKIVKDIAQISNIEKTKQGEVELLSYQVEEIEQANISKEEETKLTERKKLIKNSENIITSLNKAYQLLGGNEEFNGICGGLQQSSDILNKISDISDKMLDLSERMFDVSEKCQDMLFEIRSSIDDFDVNLDEIDEIEERLDVYYKLKRKYGDSVDSILEYCALAKEKLNSIEFAQEKLQRLKEAKSMILCELEKDANNLTQHRKKLFENLSSEIENALVQLNMPNVKMYLNIEDKDYSKDGKDDVEFYIVTNKGEMPKPLSKIASGGELSRIMLAIKSVLADKQITDTMIFDEIDVGVSGSAAVKIGKLIRKISKNHQVFCITHSPQIAAFADNHLYIEKNENLVSTFTNIRQLSDIERVNEIARIISGENITETTIESAREMIEIAKNS